MFEKDSFKFSLPMLLLLLLLQTTGLNSSVHCSMSCSNDAAAASAVDMFIIFPRKVRHKNNCAAVVVVVIVVFIFFSSFKVFCFLNCELFTSILSQFAIVTTIIGIPYFTTVKRVSDQVL